MYRVSRRQKFRTSFHLLSSKGGNEFRNATLQIRLGMDLHA